MAVGDDDGDDDGATVGVAAVTEGETGGAASAGGTGTGTGTGSARYAEGPSTRMNLFTAVNSGLRTAMETDDTAVRKSEVAYSCRDDSSSVEVWVCLLLL